MEHFEKLLQDARKISNTEYQDTSLTSTNAEMNENIEKLKQA